jgi:hypothetical protein
MVDMMESITTTAQQEKAPSLWAMHDPPLRPLKPTEGGGPLRTKHDAIVSSATKFELAFWCPLSSTKRQPAPMKLHGSTAPRLIGGSQRVAERKRARFQCTAAASRRHFFQRIQAACGIPSMHRAVCVCQCPERQMHRTRACRQWQTGRAPVKLIPASRADGSCDEQEARGSVADGPRMVQQPAGTWHRARAWRIGRVPSFRHPKP